MSSSPPFPSSLPCLYLQKVYCIGPTVPTYPGSPLDYMPLAREWFLTKWFGAQRIQSLTVGKPQTFIDMNRRQNEEKSECQMDDQNNKQREYRSPFILRKAQAPFRTYDLPYRGSGKALCCRYFNRPRDSDVVFG